MQNMGHFYQSTSVCWNRIIDGEWGQYYGYWCPGSLRHQAIGSHGIDYVE